MRIESEENSERGRNSLDEHSPHLVHLTKIAPHVVHRQKPYPLPWMWYPHGMSKQLSDGGHNEAPERVTIKQVPANLKVWRDGQWVEQMMSVLSRELDGAVGEYVHESLYNAQREEVERLKALLAECRRSVEFHAENIDGMVTPNWMERRRRTDELWAVMGKIDHALTPANTAKGGKVDA